MFCSKCGKKVEEGAKFCINCGAKIQQVTVEPAKEPAMAVQPVVESAAKPEPAEQTDPVPQPAAVAPVFLQEVPEGLKQKPAKKFSKKALFGVLGLVIIAAVVVWVLKFVIGRNSAATCFTESKVSLDMVDFSDGEKITLFTGAGDAVVFDLNNISDGDMNLDCSKLALLDYDQILYYADCNGLSMIDEDVISTKISDDGTTVVYTVADSKNDQICLYVYNREKEEKTLLAENVSNSDFCISPNGKTVAYVADYVSSDDFSLYLSVNNKSEKVGNTKKPIGVSDNGRYLYYIDEGRLYVKNGDESCKLCSDFEYNYMFNCDYSEIIYNSNGMCYISQKGKEKEEFLPEEFSMFLFPSSIAYKVDYNLGGMTCGVKSLTGYLYRASDSVYYVDNKGNNTMVYDDYLTYYNVSENNGSLLFLSGSDLYLLNDFSKEGEPKLLAEDMDVEFIVTDQKNSYVYYLNDDDELMYQKGSSDAKKIADDVESGNCYFDKYEEILYFIPDADSDECGQVYYSKAGSKKAKVKKMNEMTLTTETDRVYAVTNEKTGENICYFLSNGKAYELLKE